jgi:hypothetical protein
MFLNRHLSGTDTEAALQGLRIAAGQRLSEQPNEPWNLDDSSRRLQAQPHTSIYIYSALILQYMCPRTPG